MTFANHNLVYGTILISVSNKVLIVKGRKSGKWSFPKGHAEQEETELDCALRETREETGLQVSTHFQKIIHLATGVYFLYLCQTETQCTPTDTDEIIEIAWIPIHKLRKMNVNVDVNTFLRSYGKKYIEIPSNTIGYKRILPNPPQFDISY